MNRLHCLFIKPSVLYFGNEHFVWTCMITVHAKVRFWENWEILSKFGSFRSTKHFGAFSEFFYGSAVSGNVVNLQCLNKTKQKRLGLIIGSPFEGFGFL